MASLLRRQSCEYEPPSLRRSDFITASTPPKRALGDGGSSAGGSPQELSPSPFKRPRSQLFSPERGGGRGGGEQQPGRSASQPRGGGRPPRPPQPARQEPPLQQPPGEVEDEDEAPELAAPVQPHVLDLRHAGQAPPQPQQQAGRPQPAGLGGSGQPGGARRRRTLTAARHGSRQERAGSGQLPLGGDEVCGPDRLGFGADAPGNARLGFGGPAPGPPFPGGPLLQAAPPLGFGGPASGGACPGGPLAEPARPSNASSLTPGLAGGAAAAAAAALLSPPRAGAGVSAGTWQPGAGGMATPNRPPGQQALLNLFGSPSFERLAGALLGLGWAGPRGLALAARARASPAQPAAHAPLPPPPPPTGCLTPPSGGRTQPSAATLAALASPQPSCVHEPFWTPFTGLFKVRGAGF